MNKRQDIIRIVFLFIIVLLFAALISTIRVRADVPPQRDIQFRVTKGGIHYNCVEIRRIVSRDGSVDHYCSALLGNKVRSLGISILEENTDIIDINGQYIYEGDLVSIIGNPNPWTVTYRHDHDLLGWYAVQSFSDMQYSTETAIKLLDNEWTIQ